MFEIEVELKTVSAGIVVDLKKKRIKKCFFFLVEPYHQTDSGGSPGTED